jgi:hypothetical protein
VSVIFEGGVLSASVCELPFERLSSAEASEARR